MKYLFAYITQPGNMDDMTEDEWRGVMAAWNDFEGEAAEAGALIASEPLENASEATTIKVGEGDERTLSDGPFAESKEQLGGFTLLECKDRDEALEWAKKVPLGPGGVIEVRAVMDLSGFGYEDRTLTPAKATA